MIVVLKKVKDFCIGYWTDKDDGIAFSNISVCGYYDAKNNKMYVLILGVFHSLRSSLLSITKSTLLNSEVT